MRFSLKKALSSPFGLGLPVMAFFIGLPTLFFLFVTMQSVFSDPNLLITGIIYLICFALTLGYMAAAGHRFIYNLKPIVPPFNLQFLRIVCKAFAFAFNTFILILTLRLTVNLLFAALLSITTHAALIFLIVPLIIAGTFCCVFYMMAAWARFMDTFRPSLVFKFRSNFLFIKRYWAKLLRVILFAIGTNIILFIPLFAIFVAFEALAKVNIQFIYAYIFMKALIKAYLLLVNVNVLAQAYAWIKKENESNLQTVETLPVQNNETDEEDPVIMKDIVVMSDLNQADKKTSTAKTLAKTTAKAKTVTKSKVQSAPTGKKTSAKNKKS